ncbi:MAG: flagellar hook-length control protein FliK, partial [Methylococcaceae bacterium]
MNETVFQGSALLRAKAIKPKLVIKTDNDNLSAGEVSEVTFTFSKVIRGFSMTDVAVKGGTLSNLSNSGDNKTYTATFTPTANVNNLNGTLSIAAGSYTDIAGNKGTASNKLSIGGDTLAPSVTLSSNKALLRINQTAKL